MPAVMTLLGERNWYLPRWLRWLPGRSLDAAPAADRPYRPDREYATETTG